ncbi:MAG TPA: hypothetical protein VEH84_00685 [Alphaproteobacteria bacterium]|nr:hypothetical protein [Alphaproteobacteria bacterium]
MRRLVYGLALAGALGATAPASAQDIGQILGAIGQTILRDQNNQGPCGGNDPNCVQRERQALEAERARLEAERLELERMRGGAGRPPAEGYYGNYSYSRVDPRALDEERYRLAEERRRLEQMRQEMGSYGGNGGRQPYPQPGYGGQQGGYPQQDPYARQPYPQQQPYGDPNMGTYR